MLFYRAETENIYFKKICTVCSKDERMSTDRPCPTPVRVPNIRHLPDHPSILMTNFRREFNLWTGKNNRKALDIGFIRSLNIDSNIIKEH